MTSTGQDSVSPGFCILHLVSILQPRGGGPGRRRPTHPPLPRIQLKKFPAITAFFIRYCLKTILPLQKTKIMPLKKTLLLLVLFLEAPNCSKLLAQSHLRNSEPSTAKQEENLLPQLQMDPGFLEEMEQEIGCSLAAQIRPERPASQTTLPRRNTTSTSPKKRHSMDLGIFETLKRRN